MSKIVFRENFKINCFKNKIIITQVMLIKINTIRYLINKRIKINID